MNVISDGANADLTIVFQEFLIITFKDALRACDKCFHVLKKVVKYKGYETGFGDKGRFAPLYKHVNKDSLGFIVEDVVKRGYKLDEHIFLGMDIATSVLKRW